MDVVGRVSHTQPVAPAMAHVNAGCFVSIENAVPLMRHWLNPSSAALSFVMSISIVSSTGGDVLPACRTAGSPT